MCGGAPASAFSGNAYHLVQRAGFFPACVSAAHGQLSAGTDNGRRLQTKDPQQRDTLYPQRLRVLTFIQLNRRISAGEHGGAKSWLSIRERLLLDLEMVSCDA